MPVSAASMHGRGVMFTGILNVDKPLGWTSHDVVGLVRRMTGQRQVGHAGTLDPLATGVLLVMLGRATKLSDYLMAGRKCYHARIRLGVSTETDDAEGAVVRACPAAHVTLDMLKDALGAFVGVIDQVPPAYAAIKQGGVPAYKRARQGASVQIPARAVTIDALAVRRLEDGTADVIVWCSPGTYIRALARDVGARLGCGAHLSALRRLSSGDFTVAGSVSVDDLRQSPHEVLHDRIQPLETAVSTLPAIIVDAHAASTVMHGMSLPGGPDANGREAALFTVNGDLLALARYDQPSGAWRPHKVLALHDHVGPAGATAR